MSLDQDGVAGIVTRSGLDGLESEFRWLLDFQPPTQWVLGNSRG